MRDFYVSGLEVVPITSTHIPLARTQSYSHTLEQIGLGNVPSSTQEETGIFFFPFLCFIVFLQFIVIVLCTVV